MLPAGGFTFRLLGTEGIPRHGKRSRSARHVNRPGITHAPITCSRTHEEDPVQDLSLHGHHGHRAGLDACRRKRGGRSYRGVPELPAADEVQPQAQARHRDAGELPDAPLQGFGLPRYLALVRRQRRVRAQGGARVRLGTQRQLPARPPLRRRLPAPASQVRPLRAQGRAGATHGHHVRHLERPHLLRDAPLQDEPLSERRLPESQALLGGPATPHPHAHLIDAGRSTKEHQLVRATQHRAVHSQDQAQAASP